MAFRNLLCGVDTLVVAEYLTREANSVFDFEWLAVQRDSIKQAKLRHSVPLVLGAEEFLLASHGTGSGYPLLLENDAFSIQCGEFNKPNFYVTYRSHALWHYGADELHGRFLRWAKSVGLEPFRAESLSRVDFAFDYWIDAIDFDEDSFVTTAVKDVQYRKNGQVQTFSFGTSPIVLRVYNKSEEIAESSHKTWFYPLWGDTQDNVWRIEWEIRKAMLRYIGIRTFADLRERQGDLLRPLVESSASLRRKTADSNRSRWPLHPLWSDLSARISELDCLGVLRECDPGAQLDERMLRLSIAVYGYLKRIASIHALQRGKAQVTKEDAMTCLGRQIDRLHDPLLWDGEVKRRMDETRLGQW
ncbi:hypothetical protein [Propionivibrio dicarboxylicus]|uniref:Replication initiation factor n=1 Tax=Propionivibrio dicarboxylicus TaxID=83767 RepID=A0A1G7WMD3_9RHOO|nr:hypothetical protein [Propionivibrio dicarboxylicus]SDG73147.1 hypothetical protein SAMN05660652_00571 [Propionivibrio dicarboxylicus]